MSTASDARFWDRTSRTYARKRGKSCFAPRPVAQSSASVRVGEIVRHE